jgi:LacI family transcriptional regulator
VLFDRFPSGFTGTAVVTDNAQASCEATNHLIRLGHTRIAIVAGTQGISSSDERVEGFRSAMNEAGLTVRKEYFTRGNFNMKGGWECALELMKLSSPPTAVFSHNYEMTLGVMRALAELGVRCPKQVSVVGFDDFVVGMDGFSWATMFSPKLTCVAQSSWAPIARCTRCVNSSLTTDLPLITADTVATETPARVLTSRIVVRPRPIPFGI